MSERSNAWGELCWNKAMLVWMQAAPTPSERVALEQQWKLTEATDGQQAKAVALGLANLVGVIVLGNFLSDPQVLYSLANSSLSFMIGLFPLLQVRLLTNSFYMLMPHGRESIALQVLASQQG